MKISYVTCAIKLWLGKRAKCILLYVSYEIYTAIGAINKRLYRMACTHVPLLS